VGTAGSASGPAQCSGSLSLALTATAAIAVRYSGDSNYAASTSASSTIQVLTASPNFSLAANPASFTIATPGQSGSSTLTVTPSNGFSGAVALTCAVPLTMKEAACSLNPSSITAQGKTSLTVTTTGPHTVAALASRPERLAAGAGAILLLVILVGFPVERRRTELLLGLVLIAALALMVDGCGGGGTSSGGTTDPGTPAGSYAVTVTGTSGSLSHTQNVSVTVP
jgi:hypothetical protein